MVENIVIKKLSPNEIELAKELILMFGFDTADNSLPDDHYIAKMLDRPEFHVLVALHDKDLIGGLTAYEMMMFKRETTEMFLYEIEVDELYRRKGIGTALIEFLKEICLAKGIFEIFVGTEKDNLPARKLYATTGGEADEDSIWFSYKF